MKKIQELLKEITLQGLPVHYISVYEDTFILKAGMDTVLSSKDLNEIECQLNNITGIPNDPDKTIDESKSIDELLKKYRNSYQKLIEEKTNSEITIKVMDARAEEIKEFIQELLLISDE